MPYMHSYDQYQYNYNCVPPPFSQQQASGSQSQQVNPPGGGKKKKKKKKGKNQEVIVQFGIVQPPLPPGPPPQNSMPAPPPGNFVFVLRFSVTVLKPWKPCSTSSTRRAPSSKYGWAKTIKDRGVLASFPEVG
jgi:hypothetical protein